MEIHLNNQTKKKLTSDLMTKVSPNMKLVFFFFAELNATFFLCYYFHGPGLLMKNT